MTIGFGILGTGDVADLHRQAIEAHADLGAHLVAVSHYDPARFDAISAKLGVPCLSQEDLLAHPDVDVVCIGTPGGHHAAQTVAAAHAGKHVLVEKPMALTLAAADAMVLECRKAGVKLGVTLQRRAEPQFQRVYRAIQAGDLGELTQGVVTVPYYRSQKYYDLAEWRGTWSGDGGGVLINQGIHLIDLLVWYMGDPVSVQAYAGTLHREIEAEDTLAAVLRFENGALATVAATTTAAPGFPHRVEIYGTKGGIQLAGESVRQWLVADPANARIEPPVIETTESAGARDTPRGVSTSGHVEIFRDFIQAVREDRVPLVDGSEGRRSLAAVLAIYEAAGLLPRPEMM
jgi:UDP-N-acetyl-2-amino-2-deoxyglucuronate dehydrogenase